ncbi:hypothetical protein EV363DRAFT_1321005 [Boletus edulis]|nr:hypothetical protein EV363DRAFT_1321005 [Boletus edulis]
MSSSLNIIVFGETGAGKSSVINLIAGRHVTDTAPDVQGCTMSFKPYSFPINGRTFHIWDTGVNGYLLAIEQACELIHNLSSQGGVDLLLFCIRGNKVTATTQSNYRLFFEVLCRSQVPIAFVITHLEREADMEEWWERNSESLEKYGLNAAGHACVAGLPTHSKYRESQRNIARLLEGHNGQGRFNMPPEGWLVEYLRLFGLFAPLKKESSNKDIISVLTNRCKLDPKVAEELATMLESGLSRTVAYASAAGDSSLPTQPRSINIVLFGETGAGKSSVINLIARRAIARVSSDVNGRTIQSTRYDISFDDLNFAIFDTIDLEEPQMGVNGYLKAIEKAYELVARLGAAGGIHLLLFCIRAGEITATTQSNYRLFYENLCSTKVPIALVFTGLEREVEMEDWWLRNKTHIEHYGIKSHGHACITAVQDDTPGEDLKYIESQRKIRELLKTCALQNDHFSPELHPWFARLGRGLRSFIEKRKNPKRRDVMRVLTHRCKLDPETAKKIASMMEKGDTETNDWNQDEQEGNKDNEGRSNPVHVKDEVGDVKKNTVEVDPRSANLPRRRIKGGVEPCDVVVVEQARSEQVDRKQKSGVASTVRGSSPIVAPVQRSFEELERLGDAAVDAKRYSEAISRYSTALSLISTSQTILIKRSKAWLATRSWKEALDDANQVVTLDLSSPWGYKMKHVVLHEIGDYDNAIEAFETMLSKMKNSSDPDVQQEGDEYISPSSTQAEIRKIVQQTIRRLPRVLINTTTGRLHDRAEHASAFESLPVFKELVSSTTKRIDYVRIKREVRQYFQYVMLSHKWEDNEPLFQKVIHIAVYDLDKSPTHDKLQTFCNIVRDAGFNWAWSDTCCIDKSDHFVLQEALVAMFRWYQGSTMVIVFLRGVRPSSPWGALAASIWNTRGWTLQEYIATKVIRFYTEDWTLYRDLDLPNHKECPEIISEMEQATGVSAPHLMVLSPGLSNIREKLRLASTRRTTWVEDAAYSLLGIFSVTGIPAIYGEGESSLGRLLAHVLTGSGDVSILAWTGESSSFNSCLPTHITVFNGPATSHLPRSIPDAEMETAIVALQPSPYLSRVLKLNGRRNFDLDAALRLYDPGFAASRMKLPCIVFQLPPLHAQSNPCMSSAFGTVEIKTRRDLSQMHSLYIVHPWLDALLGREDMHRGAFAEDNVAPSPSPNTDDEEFFDNRNEDEGTDGPWLPGPELRPHPVPIRMARIDKETQARRLVARLRQPFGALLLTLVSTGGRAVDYRRVAADSLITVQLQEDVSLVDILDNVRVLEVL